MDQPFGAPLQDGPRPLTPGDVRAVVFSTTRLRMGYDVEAVDEFLDRVCYSMEQMTGEISRLRRLNADADSAYESRVYDLRLALEQVLVHVGGPTGATNLSMGDSLGAADVPLSQLPPPVAAPVAGLAPPPGFTPSLPPPPAPSAFTQPDEPGAFSAPTGTPAPGEFNAFGEKPSTFTPPSNFSPPPSTFSPPSSFSPPPSTFISPQQSETAARHGQDEPEPSADEPSEVSAPAGGTAFPSPPTSSGPLPPLPGSLAAGATGLSIPPPAGPPQGAPAGAETHQNTEPGQLAPDAESDDDQS